MSDTPIVNAIAGGLGSDLDTVTLSHDDSGASNDRTIEPGSTETLSAESGAPIWWRDLWKPILAFVAGRLLIVLTWAIQGSARNGVMGWDSGWYLSVLSGGYSTTVPPGGDPGQANVAFFPAFPVSGRLLSRSTGLTPEHALIVINLTAGLIATCIIWRFARELWGPVAADRAAVLFSFAAGSFVLSMLYSEGLFIASASAACYLLWRERHLAAGLMGALAGATRPTGIAVCLAFAAAVVVAKDGPTRLRALAAGALSTVGTLGYFMFLRCKTGSWTTWFDVERDGWGERTSLFNARYSDFHNSLRMLLHPDSDPHWMSVTSTVGLVVTAIGILLLIWKRGPLILIAYSVGVSATLFTSAPIGFRPRMVMAIFPVYMAFAAAVRTRLQFLALAALSGASAVTFALVITQSRVLTP